MAPRSQPYRIEGNTPEQMANIDEMFGILFDDVRNDSLFPAQSASTVLRTDGTTPEFAKVQLTTDVTGDLPFANLVPASAISVLAGRGAAAGAGDFQEITLGSGLSMTNQVLSSSASGPWTTTVVKSMDETVTNSATLQDDDELLFAMLANEYWYFELLVIYSGNDASGDMKFNFTFPSSSGCGESLCAGQGDAITKVNHIVLVGTIFTVNGIAGVDGTNTVNRTMLFKGFLAPTANGNLQFQFAVQSAAVGRTAIVRASSTLRGQKIA